MSWQHGARMHGRRVYDLSCRMYLYSEEAINAHIADSSCKMQIPRGLRYR